MAVDLADYIDNLKREINPPGVTMDINATDDELVGHLSDAWWEATIDGFDYLLNFNGPDIGASGLTTITPKNVGGPDVPREIIQLVIFYAGIRIVKNRLQNIQSRFSAKAGPVSVEIEHSAQMLQLVYKDLLQRRVITLRRLSDVGILPTVVFDQLRGNDWGLYHHEIVWER